MVLFFFIVLYNLYHLSFVSLSENQNWEMRYNLQTLKVQQIDRHFINTFLRCFQFQRISIKIKKPKRNMEKDDTNTLTTKLNGKKTTSLPSNQVRRRLSVESSQSEDQIAESKKRHIYIPLPTPLPFLNLICSLKINRCVTKWSSNICISQCLNKIGSS